MSSRALKRLNKNKLEDELAKFQKSNVTVDESDFEEEKTTVVKSKTQNAFSMFNDSDEDSDNLDELEEKSQPEDVSDFKFKSNNANYPVNAKKSFKNQNHVDDLDDDELDKILADARKRDNSEKIQFEQESNVSSESEYEDEDVLTDPFPIITPGGKLLTVKKYKKWCHLLKVDPTNLNPDKEYQNLFGKLSSAAIDEADSTTSTFVSPEILKEIKKLSKRVRGWSGRDRRSVPGTSRKLKLTKIRDDWIPISKKPLSMDEMTQEQSLALFGTKYKNDWKDVINDDLSRDYKSGIKYYQVNPGPSYSVEASTEFFMSVVVQPDHESLIRLLQKAPYHIETILQVANIIQRQGDVSNSNGLIERALFIVDWSFSNSFELGDAMSRLPFEFYYNRQVCLSMLRYMTILSQKSTFYTVFNYCKLLLSFDPADDSYGVRYFIDYYAFIAGEYEWLIDFYNSPLCQTYSEWCTPTLCYTVSLCYFKLGKKDLAIKYLKDAYLSNPHVAHDIMEKLGEVQYPWLWGKVSPTVQIITSIYAARIDVLLEEPSVKKFIKKELATIIETVGKPNLTSCYFYNLKNIPANLLRHVYLSNISSAMAHIPESFWKENDVYEFDVLPPKIGTTVYNYINSDKIADGMIQQTMQVEDLQALQDLLQQTVIENR
ncbi:Rqc1 protein [Martiniozyma asiatica (nom. inval.)]|nr:Rqc1 protein [Martiniozyma asiatica]